MFDDARDYLTHIMDDKDPNKKFLVEFMRESDRLVTLKFDG